MKTTILCSLVLVVATLALPISAEPACKGRLVTQTNQQTGITLTTCFDGKYSTCIRDSLRFGNTAEHAKATCDERRRLGKVK
jgi:hypothetical protein